MENGMLSGDAQGSFRPSKRGSKSIMGYGAAGGMWDLK